MKQVIDRVVDSILDSGLVEVEVSARHVHLTQEDVEKLFGKGAVLHEKRALSQKGQYLSEERVTIIGPKGRMERVFHVRCFFGHTGFRLYCIQPVIV